MNFLWKGLMSTVSAITRTATSHVPKHDGFINSNLNSFVRYATIDILQRIHDRGPPKQRKKKISPLLGRPMAKGVVIRTLIKKPRKPNSANRKCVLVRLPAIGKEMVAFVPGIGHNLQEHQTVLVECKRLKDTPGVKLRCIRGAYDLPHVKK